MAGDRISQLSTITTIADDDLLVGVDTSDTTQSDDGSTVNFTKSNFIKEVTGDITTIDSSLLSGWREVSDSWSYASATTITVPSDATATYAKGDRLRLKQGGAYKYFYIVDVAKTVLTVTGGDDYSVASAEITDIAVSKVAQPLGFPASFNYTPTLSATTTPPTLGVGANRFGTFSVNGSRMVGHGFLQFGTSGTNAGSGDYICSTPLKPAKNTVAAGSARLNAGSNVPAIAYRFGSDIGVRLISPSGYVSNSSPSAWGANNLIAYYFDLEY